MQMFGTFSVTDYFQLWCSSAGSRMLYVRPCQNKVTVWLTIELTGTEEYDTVHQVNTRVVCRIHC